MPGAPKQFNCDAVLLKALEVFWAKGYEATSIQDLVDAMGISRASMYDTFGNKRDLFLLAFNQYCQSSMETIKSILGAGDAPLSNLKTLLLMMTQRNEEGKHYGCFANNVAIELGPHDAEIAKLVGQFWQQVEDVIGGTLATATRAGQISIDTDIETTAALINSMLQGLVSMSKVGVTNQKQYTIIDQLMTLLTSP